MPSLSPVPGPISAADLMANSNAITQAEQNRAQAISTGGVLTNANDSTRNGASGGFDKDMFMQLMIAQLKYQNPLEPTDTNAMVQQASQMNMAEQMNNLATNFQAALKQSQMANATGMLGHQVTYTGPDGNPVTAWVTGVVFGKDPVITTSQDHKLTMDQIQSIGAVPKPEHADPAPSTPNPGATVPPGTQPPAGQPSTPGASPSGEQGDERAQVLGNTSDTSSQQPPTNAGTSPPAATGTPAVTRPERP
ncbi:flagellar hook assembly protein FlgD [Stomatohabitans albus]|uniref:flagellar hook assembly protein FlgD n=1 Tax=Stomatohabitans albus TaxID=3110766 RepID=UPI00300D46FD